MHCLLGTVIGFERTTHSVAEDAGNITECVILSHIDTSTSSRRFGVDVTAITTNSKCFKNELDTKLHVFFH